MSKDCQELKNIKYKSMLLNGNSDIIKETNNNISTIDDILEKEKLNSKSEPWSKLDKTVKLMKLRKFADAYATENSLSSKDIKALNIFLSSSLDKKKLQRSKDVIYDKGTCVIKAIPCLSLNRTTKKFTLKRCDKRQSTLKSLAPIKQQKKTKRKKDKNEKIDTNIKE